MTEARTFRPDWASAPGDTIEDLLEERCWSQAEFADRTGFTRKHINDLIKGRTPITPDAAQRLANVLGSSIDFWLVREAQYQAAGERRKADLERETEVDWLRELPLAFMIQHGWVVRVDRKADQVAECLRFFGVACVAAWRERYAGPLAAFRTSAKAPKKVGAVASWLREGERRATRLPCNSFDKAGFRVALGGLRALSREGDPNVFVPRLVERCAAHGVAVTFVPAPTGCPASGATRWLSPDKAMLLLSLRYKTNDHLWFTFFHEAGHLLLHGKKLLFLEGLDGLDLEAEDEANRFAGDLLIQPAAVRRLSSLAGRGRYSEAAILAFAAEVGVAPGIVVGRLQKEKLLPWTHLNKLKVRYTWGAAAKAA